MLKTVDVLRIFVEGGGVINIIILVLLLKSLNLINPMQKVLLTFEQ